MEEPCEEHICIWHPDGRKHQLIVMFASTPTNALIGAEYESGCAKVELGARVACWRVDYEPPTQFDSGHICFGDGRSDGDGRIDIEIQELRGIGLGSLLMLPLVRWSKTRPGDVPVDPILLQGSDAKTDGERDRRNTFYGKLGFDFKYEGERTYGGSKAMLVSKLVTPTFKMSRGWQVESLSVTGSVF